MNFPQMIHSGCWNGGHCQGIAVDTWRECIYYSFTTMLVKTDMQGNVLGTVTGLLGHLGCIAFNQDDGRLYGSLEYKMDAIGQGILQRAGKSEIDDGFYIAVFDVEKIDMPGLDACRDDVMTAVHLKEVLDDYHGLAENGCLHRHGCSGIDGVTFAPIPGERNGKKHLFVAYGVYGDVTREDNDYQVLLCYDTESWGAYERPLRQEKMHRFGPEAPLHKYFVYTGNTTYGVQNLEYDPYGDQMLMAVYPGKKDGFENYAMFSVDGKAPARKEKLKGMDMEGEVLSLKGEGWHFPHGSTGLCALGNGQFYVSLHGKKEEGHYTDVRLYQWDGVHPLVKKRNAE